VNFTQLFTQTSDGTGFRELRQSLLRSRLLKALPGRALPGRTFGEENPLQSHQPQHLCYMRRYVGHAETVAGTVSAGIKRDQGGDASRVDALNRA
jgi:hypothetical protein